MRRSAGRAGRGMGLSRAPLESFAAQVGPKDPVVPVGGRTQWHVGGDPDPDAREVRAPAGVVSHVPEEMIVRVRAGTAVAELDAVLLGKGQMVPLDPSVPERATVGGVLAVGASGPRRLRWGPVRDGVLEARFVTARGDLVRAGGPVVKNVSGFDLCRLLVGSLGTIGLLAEVVLRTHPRPAASLWMSGEEDPRTVRRRLYRPSSILWDGHRTWVLLEGNAADIEAQVSALGSGFLNEAGMPAMPGPGRLSLAPGDVFGLPSGHEPGSFMAEVGVGTVHTGAAPPTSAARAAAPELNRRVKAVFDPSGRLNPGRSLV